MFTGDLKFEASLHGLIHKLSPDPNLHDGLFQRAYRHLWIMEQVQPGQKRSWYLDSCKFHLLDWLKSGRSVDAPKRRHRGVQLKDTDEMDEIVEDNAFPAIAANDLIEQLSLRLEPREAKVLALLDKGYGVVDTAHILKISRRTVLNYRKNIAAAALRLGFTA